MKKYLVTGGSGFIGSALVKALIKNGDSVRVFDNNSRGNLRRLDNILSEIDFIQGDIRDIDAVNTALKGIESVLHLAYVNGTEFFYEKPDLILDVGVKGMLNVIDGSIKNDVSELVLASSSEVYQSPKTIPTPEEVSLIIPDPMNPRYSYGGGKLISELLTINYSKYFERTLIFRPHNVYGPDMGWEHVIPQFIVRMLNKLQEESSNKIDFEIQGSGKETRSFIYIEDFIAGLELILKKGEHKNIYHIGTDNEIEIINLVEQLGSIVGADVNIIPGSLKKGSTPRRCPDISKLNSLGFSSKFDLKEGLKNTYNWYEGNLDLKP